MHTIIIGSGLGGLSTGLILARNGHKVTLLEQAPHIGGCLQCFTRNGVRFETGMHIVGSLDKGQILSNYFDLLGIGGQIPLSRLDTDAYNIISLYGEQFRIPNGPENLTDRLATHFPNQRDSIRRYLQMVASVASSAPYYYTGNSAHRPADPELFTAPLDSVIDSTIQDPLLRQILVADLPLYAALKGRTPFATHAFVADLYNQSAFRIVGGSDILADVLADGIIRNGGEIVTSARVVRASAKDGHVTSVTTANGRQFSGDIFISDTHPSQLSSWFLDGELRDQYTQRINSLENTPSVFSLFIEFKENRQPYLNSNFYCYRNCSPWDIDPMHSDLADDITLWPKGYLYMHHCHRQDPVYARSGVVLAYIDHRLFNPWANTSIGHRDENYRNLKQQLAQQLVDAVDKEFPGTGSNIKAIHTATPLTYRDYTLTPNGSIYGIRKDVTLGPLGRISHRTKLNNLYLVGQNINSHGILGVLVGSVNACSDILKTNII